MTGAKTKPDRRQARSAARLYAVQALFQMEASGQTVEGVVAEFETHRFGAVYDDAEMVEGDVDHFRALAPGLASGAVVVLDNVNWAPMRVAHDRIAADERIAGGAVAGRFGLSIAGPA